MFDPSTWILLGEGLEVFRFFSWPEDVYYTLACNEAGCPDFPSSNFVFPEEDYCPQIIFRCLMYLHHNVHPVRHNNSFVFRHFYHLCLSNILACHQLHSHSQFARIFFQTNKKIYFRNLRSRGSEWKLRFMH